MHGPGPVTPTNPTGWEPAYPRPIRVVDTFARALPNRTHRKQWREIRTRGFSLWLLDFKIEEHSPSEFGEWEVIPGAIRIIRGASGNDSGGWIADPGGALMVLGPWPPWWKWHGFKSTAGVVCHEAGHCLGLWHREDHGVMAGGLQPDAHDLQSIEMYYSQEGGLT